jgi:hypothetical protein
MSHCVSRLFFFLRQGRDWMGRTSNDEGVLWVIFRRVLNMCTSFSTKDTLIPKDKAVHPIHYIRQMRASLAIDDDMHTDREKFYQVTARTGTLFVYMTAR